MERHVLTARNAKGEDLHLCEGGCNGKHPRADHNHIDFATQEEMQAAMAELRSAYRWDDTLGRYVRNRIAFMHTFRASTEHPGLLDEQVTDRTGVAPHVSRTSRLVAEMKKGATVLCTSPAAPREPMAYRPRAAFDPKPWVLHRDPGGPRFSAGEGEAVHVSYTLAYQVRDSAGVHTTRATGLTWADASGRLAQLDWRAKEEGLRLVDSYVYADRDATYTLWHRVWWQGRWHAQGKANLSAEEARDLARKLSAIATVKDVQMVEEWRGQPWPGPTREEFRAMCADPAPTPALAR